MEIDVRMYEDKIYEILNDLVLFRFDIATKLKDRLNKDFESMNLWVKDFGFKDYYDSDFQDYEIMICMGNEDYDYLDITVYFTVSRIGERVVVETAFDYV